MIEVKIFIKNYPVFEEIASQEEMDKLYKFIQPILVSYLNRRENSELVEEFKNDYVCDSISFLSHLVQVCGSVYLTKMDFSDNKKILNAVYISHAINSIIAQITNELGFFKGQYDFFSQKSLRVLTERLINSYNEAMALSPEIRRLMQDDLMNTYIYSKV